MVSLTPEQSEAVSALLKEQLALSVQEHARELAKETTKELAK